MKHKDIYTFEEGVEKLHMLFSKISGWQLRQVV
jgi:hypothetical protein